jgi:hypothetical protein
MNLYSHAVLAQAIQPIVAPTLADPDAYLWGAVAPDIRYLADLPRESTHPPDESIQRWSAAYPDCASFVQGYRVHCLLDRIDTVQAVSAAFPLRWLRRFRRRPFSSQQIGVVIESYTQLNAPRGLALRGSHNPILDSLGIRPEQSADFASALAPYLRSPSFQNAMQTFTQLGIINDTRLEKYINAYQNLRRSPLTLFFLMASVHNARLQQVARKQWQELGPPD